MAQPGGHRRLLTGVAVASAALTFTSASFACTVFRGKMTIQGKGTGVVTVLGNNGDMTWCKPYPEGKAKANLGGTISIAITKAGALADNCRDADTGLTLSRKSRLPAGTYDVNYTNKGFTRSGIDDVWNGDRSRQYSKDCMTITDPDTQKRYLRIGALTINDFGAGNGSVVIPTNDWDGSTGTVSGPFDEAAVCVSDRTGTFGLQAPLTIV